MKSYEPSIIQDIILKQQLLKKIKDKTNETPN